VNQMLFSRVFTVVYLYLKLNMLFVKIYFTKYAHHDIVRMPFLSRVSILTRDINIANLSICSSVCLSVCLSVRNVPVSDENGLTHRHSFFFTIR